jgi:hypothetical protein
MLQKLGWRGLAVLTVALVTFFVVRERLRSNVWRRRSREREES